MPSSVKTSYLQLNKWAGTDKLKIQDFKDDNEKIDAEFLDRGVNVKWFGAKGDGVTDDTVAFRNALNYAKNNNLKKVIAPNGIYLLSSYNTASDSNILVIPQGITLEGEGYYTEFRVNPSSINSNGSFRLFYIESFATAKNFRINGQKDLVNRAGITDLPFNAILAKDYQTDYTFKDLWVHDIIGVNKESFGVSSWRGSERVRYENIKGWNVEGTSVHVTGDYLIDKMVIDVDVINCTTYNNTWQGISLYGAKNVRIYNHHAYDNDGNGLNFEWCWDVDVYNSKSYNNGRSGFGSYGKANFKLHDCTSIGNNTDNLNWVGEITLSASAWWTGSPPPKGTAGVVEINNCKVEPLSLSNSKHIAVSADNTVNVGTGLPDGVTVYNSGVENWKITVADFGGSYKSTSYLPNMFFKGFNISQPVLLEKLSDFTFTSNLTSATYSGAGNISPNALTLTGINSQYGNAYSKYILKPNRSYHVIVRYKAGNTNKWELIGRDATQSNPSYSILLTGESSLVGQWTIAEGIFKTGSNEHRIQIQYNGTVFPDVLDIDYIVIREILDNCNVNALYDFTPMGANKIIQGTAAPTTGTWSKGDICYNTNPTAGGYLGWVCVTAGSPGTWKGFGTIQA